jgi:redox-sensitive bicupin YhaK (pirin superfamily)
MKKNNIISIKPLGFPWETQDPFIFCVHHRDEYPKGNEEMGPAVSLSGRNIGQDFIIKDGWRMYHGRKIPGFPYHPHRGFETVTVVKEGWVDHTDSLGGAGRFGQGDTQWMTAGKGIQHSEMFPLLEKDKDNPMELFQIWLNLPKVSKFVEPHYKMLWREEIPNIIHKDKNGKLVEIEVVAGSFLNKKAPDPTPDSWAANTANAVRIATIKLEAGAQFELSAVDPLVNRNIYFYRGDLLLIDGQSITNYQGIRLKADASITIEAGQSDAYLLLLEGKPLNEPVVSYGPFVMNTQQEIQEAFRDFRQTQFGGWPWGEYEFAHDRNSGRFAKYPDGTFVKK